VDLSKLLGFALGPFMAAGLGLITVPLMAWIFTPEVIGQIAMLNSFLAGSALVLTLGLDQAYVREYHEVSNKPQLLLSLASLSLLATLAFAGIVIFFNSFFISLLFTEQDNPLLLSAGLALIIIATILYRFLSLVLRMQQQALKFSLLQISAKLTLVISLSLLFFLKGKFGFVTAFSLSCLSLLVATLVAVSFTWRECYLSFKAGLNITLIKQALTFGWPLVVSGFVYWGLISVDRWAIRYYVGLEQLGVYSVAFSVAAVMTIFQQVFSTIWAPIVYQWHNKGIDITQFSIVTDWVVIVLSTVFFTACLLSPFLTLFLPPAYHDVIYLLPACMLFPLFYTLSETTVVGMNVARKTGYSIIVTLLPLALNLLLCYLLIPKYLAGGAAVAVSAAFLLYLLLRTEVSKKAWKKFNTAKLYTVALFLLLNALWPALTYSVLPWYVNIINLLVIMLLYRERLANVKQDIITIRR
jgi:O-antigen/teichoic acid export membrane protein